MHLRVTCGIRSGTVPGPLKTVRLQPFEDAHEQTAATCDWNTGLPTGLPSHRPFAPSGPWEADDAQPTTPVDATAIWDCQSGLPSSYGRSGWYQGGVCLGQSGLAVPDGGRGRV